MYFALSLLLASHAYAWPSTPSVENMAPRNDPPDSAPVIDALRDPDMYDRLIRPYQPHNEQTPVDNIFQSQNGNSCGPRGACPAYEGETRNINGREYHMYCINAPWGSYFWLPSSKNLEECEKRCHENSYDCNGLTFYPSTGACSIITSKDAAPYIWDNGYQKIGAIPVKSDVAFGPGMLCPLPGSDNQVWDFEDKKYRFKMSCRNQIKADAKDRRQIGLAKTVDECGERCGHEKDCYGFHYYQPTFPGGRLDGQRTCELIMRQVGAGDWVPLWRPNQYLSGLRVEHADCGDVGWNQDEKGRN
ncbi:hypothetical protein BS50DRAFT_311990 [Corynespora cassiicola Philippines]|uniref:Apple domain-containing protein n=1 Tax=Corynespora cassiicola Philippines TaxID=1448308 RepID=A0A2T2NYB4_CORCC|nr:hypothetical protein BS50DRAFT_311990 [Corynespora cassiicola Philippines]